MSDFDDVLAKIKELKEETNKNRKNSRNMNSYTKI